MLNKEHDTEETDASTTMKRENRSLSPFCNKDIQTEIVMTHKRDTSSKHFLITIRNDWDK